MAKRDIYEFTHESSFDTLDVRFTEGHLAIRIDEPWSGSTESGFGHEANFDLPREQAIKLAEKILAFYAIGPNQLSSEDK